MKCPRCNRDTRPDSSCSFCELETMQTLPRMRRAGTMSDDQRASQPRAPSYPLSDARVVEVDPEQTPPPIVVDELNRQIARSRRPSPSPDDRRERKNIQELVEELWPMRKALSIAFEQQERIVAVETQVAELKSTGPHAIAAAGIAALRAELIGHDGKGGIVAQLGQTMQRDLDDHREVVRLTDERATAADKFVRRVIRWAAGVVSGSIVGAVILIYSMGARSEASKAEARIERQELVHKIDSLERSLTELRGQVKLLIETRIRP